MEKKLKIYLDTSVINFLFADDAPDLKKVTINFFENNLTLFNVEISEILIAEISRTNDETKRQLLFSAIEKYNLKIKNSVTDEMSKFANNYIEAGIIPKNKFEDALHISFATFFEFDILLSWNFKHLANINKQMLINSVNLKYGFNKQLLLLNPMDVVYEK
jgi:hypothetical protein